MDTRSKNTNIFVKLIAITLAVVCMAGAFWNAINVVMTIDILGIDPEVDYARAISEGEDIPYIESPVFCNYVNCAIYDVDNYLSRGKTELDDECLDILEKIDDYYAGCGHEVLAYGNILRYYAVTPKGDKVFTNFKKGDDPKTILAEKKYAWSVVSDDMDASPAAKECIDNYIVGYNLKNDVYFYIDESAISTAHYNDPLARIIDQCKHFNSLNMRRSLIMLAMFLLLAIGFAITAFCICGRRTEDGRMKQLLFDYVPVDLHLLISGGLIATLCVAIGALGMDALNLDTHTAFADNSYVAAMMLMSACAGGVWLLLIEFVTSLIRVCHSGRKWYHCSLILLGVYCLFRLLKLELKGAKHLHARNKDRISSIKAMLGYKVTNFKKRLVLFLIGYGVLNVGLMLGCWFWMAVDFLFMCVINSIVLFAINAASVVFVARYVVALDKIIVAAANHTVPQVDYAHLPGSLRTLVDSLHYSANELQNAVNKAVRDERMRTELITNVSHDLKTPLTSIISYVDLLKDCDISDPSALEYIAILDEKGGKLKRLIEDLIEASKVTSGIVTLCPVALNLSELSTQAVVEHQQEFADNGLELVFKGDKQSIVAFADGNKTFRVIENLLSNARKYSARGTRVYADVYERNNTAVFEIKNVSSQPLDITADELKERFVRGDKSRTNEGNGLGLSIADNLCKAMGGRLDIDIDGDFFKARVILPLPKEN